MKKKGKIIYISPNPSTFVQRDITILRNNYLVVPFLYSWSSKINTPFLFIRQAVGLIWHIRCSKAILVMFGGYWSLFPSIIGKLTGRPVYIILGGTDCVSFPDLKYGSLRKPLLKTCIKWSYQLCTRLIPVDHSLVVQDYSYYEKAIYPKQGFRYFFPRLTTPYTVIFNGFDTDYWKPDPTVNRVRSSFITVGPISSETRYILKGIDLVYFLAREFPQSDFTIIGISESLRNRLPTLPPNLEIQPFLSSEKIRKRFSGAEFYLQLSISEGFPNAVCEAMLCECIPIGSNVGALPFIINDDGIIIPRRDRELIRSTIGSLLILDPEMKRTIGHSARLRIMHHFPLGNREKALAELIEGKMQG
ncbi:MAG: glycosyltransferase family 4 protein [Bacteroidales bacterium]|nr:glycosyltransferase family 4 protein [Lentimicrobiaceae bacterium]MDD5695271.1 glycosyltransferase family 4 protein [Bacteroidales bacterium]